MVYSETDVGIMTSLVYEWPSHQLVALMTTDVIRMFGRDYLGVSGERNRLVSS